jgi:hypothetical protein
MHVAMIGDSIMRYQYMSFVEYVLTNQSWRQNSEQYIKAALSLGSEFDFGARMNHEYFSPYEECDCFFLRKPIRGNFTHLYCENRYFKKKDISISFHASMGNINSIGHWDPSEVYNRHIYDFNSTTPPKWVYGLPDLISRHVAMLVPKPDWVILNVGHWPNRLNDETHRNHVENALRASGIKWAWRTTTSTKDGKTAWAEQKEATMNRYMCAVADACIDAGFTFELTAESYVDNLHFVNGVYHDINRIMFEELRLFNGGSKPTPAPVVVPLSLPAQVNTHEEKEKRTVSHNDSMIPVLESNSSLHRTEIFAKSQRDTKPPPSDPLSSWHNNISRNYDFQNNGNSILPQQGVLSIYLYYDYILFGIIVISCIVLITIRKCKLICANST